MTNINPVPNQENNSQPLVSPNLNVPPTVLKEQPKIGQVKLNSVESSNKLWMILLILFALIVGFWIGYFTNDYFFQPTAGDSWQMIEPMDEIDFEPVLEMEEEIEEEFIELQNDFIIFRGEEFYINDSINFVSLEQCVDDETVLLTAIGEDFVNLQINQWRWDEEIQENVADLIDFQVRDQECVGVRPVCMDVFIERCFSLEIIGGVYHLDYEFRQESTMPLSDELN